MQTSRSVLVCLLAAALTGCAQLLGGDAQLPQRHFYKIRAELLSADWEYSARPYPFRVQVKGFEVPRAYNRSDIIIRRDEYELRRSRQHSWMERPGDMFTDVIKEYLRQADLFTYIGGDRDFYEHRPDYVLSGSIKAIERFDSGDAWVAHLAMTIELVRQEDGRVVWADRFRRGAPGVFRENEARGGGTEPHFGPANGKGDPRIGFHLRPAAGHPHRPHCEADPSGPRHHGPAA